MSPQTERQTLARPRSVSVRRLVPAAFVAQALASLVIWLLINDESLEGGAWSNTDLREWVALSLLSTALAGVASGAATRRWDVTVAVAAGCALFVGYAVLNSA